MGLYCVEGLIIQCIYSYQITVHFMARLWHNCPFSRIICTRCKLFLISLSDDRQISQNNCIIEPCTKTQLTSSLMCIRENCMETMTVDEEFITGLALGLYSLKRTFHKRSSSDSSRHKHSETKQHLFK